MKASAAAGWLLAAALPMSSVLAAPTDQLTYHGSPARDGWRSMERVLTPSSVASGSFGPLWRSEPFDSFEDLPPRLFASPLYLQRVRMARQALPAGDYAVVYAATTTGHVYAVNARATRNVAAGRILWRQRLTAAPCSRGAYGILGTPVIDAQRQRLYVSACDQLQGWAIHALDVRTGHAASGWPVTLGAAAINAPGINGNGGNQFPSGVANLQRGALNLSRDGRHLFVTFGGEPVSGWVVMLDTRAARVASAFSTTARTEEGVGGLWASGGVSIDADGAIYAATGSSVINALAGKGAAGVYPDSDGNWGQSVIKLEVDRAGRLRLAGTYTPHNYCEAGGNDLDLGAGSPILIDLPPRSTSTPMLLLQGGTKQGNVYLLDRAHMPGDLRRRQPCGQAPADDRSLLGPDAQPQFGTRGPLNVFGPFSDRFGMGDLAKSRSTPAYFRDARGRHFVFVTGSRKAAIDSAESVAPGLVRLEIVASAAQPAHLRVDRAQADVVFQNPGSPVVSSRGVRDAIVWVLDTNRPRSAPLYGEGAPQPVLYAFDATTLALLWRSAPGELATSGKYNEPLVAQGIVVVGTDRLQAFGLRRDGRSPGVAVPPSPAAAVPPRDASATPPVSGPARAPRGAPPDERGRLLYEARCAACHDQQRSDMPSRVALGARDFAFILDKMRVGSMQPQVLGLTDGDLESIARFVIHPESLP